MKLTKLLERVEYECINGSVDVEVADLVNDSRKAKEGSLFFCIKGAVSDGHKYAADVIAKGAKVLVVQDEVEAPKDVTVIKVADSRYSIVMATAKRARELIDGAPALVYSDGKKPLSIAVEELDKGKIKILAEDESGEDEE